MYLHNVLQHAIINESIKDIRAKVQLISIIGKNTFARALH